MYSNQQPYRSPVPVLGPTPPPVDITAPSNLVYANPVDTPVLPSISTVLPQAQVWNIPCTSTTVDPQFETPNGLSSLLNLDSQQMEMKQLNSEELATLNCFETNNLSENLSANLSLTEDVSYMTDSLTRLANRTIDNMYK